MTEDGDLALKIAHGLRVGETADGELALNDSRPQCQWLEFDLQHGDGGQVRVIADRASMRLDGRPLADHPLRSGITVALPHNAVCISRGLTAPPRRGAVLDVRPVSAAGESRASDTAGERAARTDADAAPVPEPDPQAQTHRPAAGPSVEPVAEPAAEPAAGAPQRRQPEQTQEVAAGRAWSAAWPVAVGALAAALLALLLVVMRGGAGQPAVQSGPAPAGEETAPAAIERAPAAIETAPAAEEKAPAAEEKAPAAAKTAPLRNETPAEQPPPGERAGAPADAAPDPHPLTPALAARLERARRLLDAGQITYPPGDNAVAVLTAVLEADAGNPAAMALLGDCTTRMIDTAVAARAQGRDYEARNTLEEVLAFNPDHPEARRLWQAWVESDR